jgi:hypothetical protein
MVSPSWFWSFCCSLSIWFPEKYSLFGLIIKHSYDTIQYIAIYFRPICGEVAHCKRRQWLVSVNGPKCKLSWDELLHKLSDRVRVVQWALSDQCFAAALFVSLAAKLCPSIHLVPCLNTV